MRNDIVAVQDETGVCMNALESLYTLQSKIQIVKESLQESDGNLFYLL